MHLIKNLIKKDISKELPASFLRRHSNCKVILDREAFAKVEIDEDFPFKYKYQN